MTAAAIGILVGVGILVFFLAVCFLILGPPSGGGDDNSTPPGNSWM